MKKLEITKKECAILDYAGHVCINDGPFYEDNNVLDMDTAGENAALDHATLFLDSIQAYQECELLPSELLKQNKELREALEEARLQIEYLHGKFQETGTGNAVLSHIDTALKNSKL